MSPDATVPTASNEDTQSSFRNRFSVNERLIVSISAAYVVRRFYQHPGRLSIQMQCDASSSPADESEKRVRSPAVKLLVRHRL